MKTHYSNIISNIGLLTTVLLITGATTQSADTPSLKDAYKEHFIIGAAINRTIATGTAVRADNVNRTMEMVHKDIATVMAQYNQISPENDLKWALIHPREGENGYNFGPADAFVDFGIKNNMYIVGHTLVWHSQTPNWVFQGTNPPPTSANTQVSGQTASTNLASTNASGVGRFGRGTWRWFWPFWF